MKLHALVPVAGIGDVGPANVLDDPAGKRNSVTLKAGDWNAATVRLKGAKVSLEVNGVLVHERDLDPADDRTFSLYHDKAATLARVRNIVLRGDWPSEVPARVARGPAPPLDPRRRPREPSGPGRR